MKFTEAQLEQAIIELLEQQGYPHTLGCELNRNPGDVLIESDFRAYLSQAYKADGITPSEIDVLIRQLQSLPSSDLYESNKRFSKWLCDGFLLKREDRSQKDLYIQFIDYNSQASTFVSETDLPIAAEKSAHYGKDINIYRMVNQMEIEGPASELRIPDGILYINGLPLVVFEFKSAIREDEANIHHAFVQLTTRYRRDIPQLFVYNAFCVISDGVNSKMGSLFAPYDFFYAWRKVTGDESVEQSGINALHSMIEGLFNQSRLCDVIRNFIYYP